MPLNLSRERVKRPIDETACDWCGCPLLIGDRVLYDLAHGTAYCGASCAEQDHAEHGYGTVPGEGVSDCPD
jgi:hypothetical protein